MRRTGRDVLFCGAAGDFPRAVSDGTRVVPPPRLLPTLAQLSWPCVLVLGETALREFPPERLRAFLPNELCEVLAVPLGEDHVRTEGIVLSGLAKIVSPADLRAEIDRIAARPVLPWRDPRLWLPRKGRLSATGLRMLAALARLGRPTRAKWARALGLGRRTWKLDAMSKEELGCAPGEVFRRRTWVGACALFEAGRTEFASAMILDYDNGSNLHRALGGTDWRAGMPPCRTGRCPIGARCHGANRRAGSAN